MQNDSEDDDYWREGDVDGNRLPLQDATDAKLQQAETFSADGTQSAEESHPYNRLTPEVIIEAVESSGRISDARIFPLNSYENRVYQVGLQSAEPVIAKFYRPDRWTRAQIQEEHDFCQYLRDLDIPVVAPLRDDNGCSLFEFEGFLFSLSPRQGGRAPELDNLEHLKQLGQFIGRLHAAGESYTFKTRWQLSLQRMGIDSVDYLAGSGFIPEDLLPAYTALSAQLLEILQGFVFKGAATLSLHGDCHPGNVLWRDGRPHFVDFDDAISGPAIQDLWMLLSGDSNQRQRQLDTIVEGYEGFRHFEASELNLIEPLRAVRVLHYNAWLARRWSDPAFPLSFPWFNTQRYWSEHILELKELLASLHEDPLQLSCS